MNRIEASRLVTIALAARPTPASFLDGEAVEDMGVVWHLLLADIPYDAAEAALAVVLAGEHCSGKLPGPELVRRRIMAEAFGPRRSGGDAWGEFRQLYRRLAGRGAPSGDDTTDATLLVVVERMGWDAWGQTDSSASRAAYRSQWISLYDQLAQQRTEARNVATLPAAQRLSELAGDLAKQLADPERRQLGGGIPQLALTAGDS